MKFILSIIMVFLLFSCNDKNKKNDTNTIIENKVSEKFTEKQNTAVSNDDNTKEKEDKIIYNIFCNNIFDGISSSPEFYKDKNFIIQECIPDEYGYARIGADMVVEVENSEIEITYLRINKEYRIQLVIIKDKTDISVWSKYIGETAENILKYFKKPYRVTKDDFYYESEDWKYFIRFNLENQKVYEVVLGLTL